MKLNPKEKMDSSQILGVAVMNAGAKLGLSASEVGRVIGRDRTSITRNGVDPKSPSGQLALLLVRVYRGLYVLVGGRDDQMAHWMRTRIRSLQGIPREMIREITGMVHVVEYIDAMRGKV